MRSDPVCPLQCERDATHFADIHGSEASWWTDVEIVNPYPRRWFGDETDCCESLLTVKSREAVDADVRLASSALKHQLSSGTAVGLLGRLGEAVSCGSKTRRTNGRESRAQ
jgi:hypothetical protein